MVSLSYFLDEKWRLREAKSFVKIVKHGIESGSNFMSADFRAQSLTQYAHLPSELLPTLGQAITRIRRLCLNHHCNAWYQGLSSLSETFLMHATTLFYQVLSLLLSPLAIKSTMTYSSSGISEAWRNWEVEFNSKSCFLDPAFEVTPQKSWNYG